MPDSFADSNRCGVTAVTSMHSWMAALQASLATKPKTWRVGHEGCADALLTDANKSCQKTSADSGQVAGRAWLFPS